MGLHLSASIIIILNVCTLLAIYKFQGLMRPTLHISSPPDVSTASEIPTGVGTRDSPSVLPSCFCSWMGWRSPKFPKRKICLPVSNLASSSLPKTLELLGGVVLRIPNPNHQSCPIPLWIPHPRVYLPIFSASCPIHPFSKLLSYWAKLAAQSRLLSYAGTLPSWKVLSNQTRTGWCCLLVGGWVRLFFIDPGKLTAGNPKMEVNGTWFSF